MNVKEMAIVHLYQEHERYLARVTGKAGEKEEKSYLLKLDASMRLLQGQPSPFAEPLMGTEALESGMTLEEFAQYIFDKSMAMQKAIGFYSTCRKKAEALILASDIEYSSDVSAIIKSVYEPEILPDTNVVD